MIYKAFLSYNTADSERVAAVHSALLRFAKPWYRLRALHLFRDQTNLSATPELWSTIQAALDESESFILLGSPEAAASKWVTREVQHWCTTKSADKIIIVATSGTIVWSEQENDFDWERTTALPKVMAKRYTEEPLWIDLSWADQKEHYSLRNLRFRSAIATIAAPLHGLSKEELDGEDVRQHKRTKLLVQLVILVLSLLLVISYWQYRNAEARRRVGLSRQLAAQAATLLDDHYDRALLLCVQALRFAPTLEARNALFSSLATPQHPSTFLRQGDSINRLAFSADNAFLAAGSYDKIVIWDIAHPPLTPRTIPVDSEGNHFSLAFARLEDAFAISTRTGVVLWNAKAGRPEPRKFDSAVSADSLAVSGDGQLIAFLDSTGAMHLRSRRTGIELTQPVAIGLKPHDPIVFSPDGHLLAVASDGGRILLWRVKGLLAPSPLLQPQVLKSELIPTEDIRHMAATPTVVNIGFAGDGTTLLAGTTDGVRLWDIENEHAVSPPRAIRTEAIDAPFVVNAYALSNDGRILAAGYNDGSIRVWNVVEGTGPAQPLTGHANPLWSLAVSADGSRLAAGYEDGVVRIWDLGSPSLGHTLNIPERSGGQPIAFIPKPDRLITPDDDGIYIRETRTGAPVQRLSHSNFSVTSLAVDSYGRRIAAGGEDGLVRIWDLPSGALAFPPLASDSRQVMALAFSPDGRTLASGDSDGRLVMWLLNKTPRALVTKLAVHGMKPPTIQTVAFTSDGIEVLAGTSAGTAVWQWLTGHTRISQFGAGLATAFSSGAHLLASQDFEDTVRLWNVRSGKPIGPPIASVNAVNDIAFSPNGEILALTDGSGVVRFWDVASGQRFGPPLARKKGAAFRIAFNSDGSLLAVDEEGVIVLWNLSVSSWQRNAQATANRNFTQEEWLHYIPDDKYMKTFEDLP